MRFLGACFLYRVLSFPDFLPVPFWKHPRSARSQLTKTSKRLRGEKGPRFPFINSSDSNSLSSSHWVLFLLPVLFLFVPRPLLRFCFAMARFGFVSLALLSLQALIGTSFAAVCSHPPVLSHLNANCFANVTSTN